jgi:hypothetical protein
MNQLHTDLGILLDSIRPGSAPGSLLAERSVELIGERLQQIG